MINNNDDHTFNLKYEHKKNNNNNNNNFINSTQNSEISIKENFLKLVIPSQKKVDRKPVQPFYFVMNSKFEFDDRLRIFQSTIDSDIHLLDGGNFLDIIPGLCYSVQIRDDCKILESSLFNYENQNEIKKLYNLNQVLSTLLNNRLVTDGISIKELLNSMNEIAKNIICSYL